MKKSLRALIVLSAMLFVAPLAQLSHAANPSPASAAAPGAAPETATTASPSSSTATSSAATAAPTAPQPTVAQAITTPQISPTSKTGTEIIKNFYVQLVSTMRQGDQLGFAGRYKKLKPAITSAFNLPLMTRFSVGLDWSKATPEEQQALTTAFSDFSVANYASQFKSYNGEKFRIVGEKPVSSGGIMVETSLTPVGHEPVAINYLMKPDEQGQLRVVDIFLDGSISELATRRSEFTSIVRRDGIAALVTSLGDKTKQLGPS